MSENVLCAWLGRTDIRATEGDPEVGSSPIAKALEIGGYNALVLLSNYSEKTVANLRRFREKIGKVRFQKAHLAVNRVLARRSIGRELSDLLYNIAIGSWSGNLAPESFRQSA